MSILRGMRFFAAWSALCAAGWAFAQHPIIYPAKGQSPAQQKKDDGECYVWAKDNTGVDPSAPQPQAAQTESAPRGERLRGAARGAAAGAIIGEVASDDAGKGAAIGATAGVLAGGARARRHQAEAAHRSQAEQQQAGNAYQRAYAACMEGRGYTVK